MIIAPGFPEPQRAEAARLYWQAFRDKLRVAMGPEDKALRFIAQVMRPDHAISAYDDDGQLLGVVGFKTPDGALVDGGFAEMRRTYGLTGAAWRALLLSLLVRDIDNTRFLMDGIFVDQKARGQGVGSALLRAVYDEARKRGYREIRLDVIDTNPRARTLYEREGFEPVDTQQLGLLRKVFGFASSTTMVRSLQPEPISAPAANTSAPPTTT